MHQPVVRHQRSAHDGGSLPLTRPARSRPARHVEQLASEHKRFVPAHTVSAPDVAQEPASNQHAGGNQRRRVEFDRAIGCDSNREGSNIDEPAQCRLNRQVVGFLGAVDGVDSTQRVENDVRDLASLVSPVLGHANTVVAGEGPTTTRSPRRHRSKTTAHAADRAVLADERCPGHDGSEYSMTSFG